MRHFSVPPPLDSPPVISSIIAAGGTLVTALISRIRLRREKKVEPLGPVLDARDEEIRNLREDLAQEREAYRRLRIDCDAQTRHSLALERAAATAEAVAQERRRYIDEREKTITQLSLSLEWSAARLSRYRQALARIGYSVEELEADDQPLPRLPTPKADATE